MNRINISGGHTFSFDLRGSQGGQTIARYMVGSHVSAGNVVLEPHIYAPISDGSLTFEVWNQNTFDSVRIQRSYHNPGDGLPLMRTVSTYHYISGNQEFPLKIEYTPRNRESPSSKEPLSMEYRSVDVNGNVEAIDGQKFHLSTTTGNYVAAEKTIR